jgi:hypothetical protein
LLLQLTQNDVGLLMNQGPHLSGVDPAGTTTLRNALAGAGSQFRAMDLDDPAVADFEPLGQLPECAFPGSIGGQDLLSQIVTICSRHGSRFEQNSTPWKESRSIPQRKML